MRTERLALAAALLIALPALSQEKKAEAPKKAGPVIAVVGADIHTVTKGVIKNGVILIQDGKILKVGADLAVPDGATRIDARAKSSPVRRGQRVGRGDSRREGGLRAGSAHARRQHRPTGVVDSLPNPYDRNIHFCPRHGITTACVELGWGGRRGASAVRGRSAACFPFDETSVCPCCG